MDVHSEGPADLLQVGGVAALKVQGNFMFDSATHRDFLGACLGTGIERSKVGDIILNGERGAFVLVVPEMVEYLSMQLTSVSLDAHHCYHAPHPHGTPLSVACLRSIIDYLAGLMENAIAHFNEGGWSRHVFHGIDASL